MKQSLLLIALLFPLTGMTADLLGKKGIVVLKNVTAANDTATEGVYLSFESTDVSFASVEALPSLSGKMVRINLKDATTLRGNCRDSIKAFLASPRPDLKLYIYANSDSASLALYSYDLSLPLLVIDQPTICRLSR